MKEFNKGQISAIENFISACEQLKKEGVIFVGWNDGTFDAVNEKFNDWDVRSKSEEINYPHFEETFKYRDMIFPSIFAGFAHDGYGIMLTDK